MSLAYIWGSILQDRKTFKHYWLGKKAKNLEMRGDRRVVVELIHGRVQVVSPFNQIFVEKAKVLMGRWKPRTFMWTFAPHQAKAVIRICDEAFGPGKVELYGFPYSDPRTEL